MMGIDNQPAVFRHHYAWCVQQPLQHIERCQPGVLACMISENLPALANERDAAAGKIPTGQMKDRSFRCAHDFHILALMSCLHSRQRAPVVPVARADAIFSTVVHGVS